MEGFTRKRSNSVPILSQIEKVLDHKEDLGLNERRSSAIFSRFCETRSPGDTTRPKVRLSSGGLIRNQKRRRSRTMGNTQTGSTQICEQEQDTVPEQVRPRAFTTSEVENTEDGSESSPTGKTISHSLLNVDEYPQRHDVKAEEERYESLSLMTKGEDASVEQASDIIYNNDTPDDCRVTDQEQATANIDSCSKEDSLHSRSSTEISLSYEIGDLEEQTPDLTNSSTIDSSKSDKSGSLISDFDRLAMIQLHRSEMDEENELFSEFRRRRNSLPFSLEGQQKQTDSIQKQLKKALDVFFSQKAVDGYHVGRGRRSKSLPNVYEGVKNLNFEKITKMNIPEAVTSEGRQVYDAVNGVREENLQSCSDKEKITNEETKSDVISGGDELELRISTPVYCHDLPSVPRPRGFSIPCSFKMEKILEEPNESENCDGVASNDQGDAKNVTHYLCDHHFNQTMDCTPLNDNSGVSEQAEDPFTESDVNKRSTFESKTEENQQHNSFEQNLELFDGLVTETFSRMQQLEFSSSSSCLHRAAAKGDLESIKILVEGGNDVNALDEFGWPVLHAAVTTGNFDCFEWLIDTGADLETYTNFVIEEYQMLCRQVYQNY
ncbi:Protein phosphatase 1 regulatory subunit 12A [Stylophora pistillata]|uniref:Protein phosphatase 1 regulatory subunit 12A n=1 Tax=Stylophora pistillata TaxID=50429 RepID=A0A2B4RHW3_STYPI|nr:Protein phosphatase 1 regulatory subunit 12A [Stylophora pistillata]